MLIPPLIVKRFPICLRTSPSDVSGYHSGCSGYGINRRSIGATVLARSLCSNAPWRYSHRKIRFVCGATDIPARRAEHYQLRTVCNTGQRLLSCLLTELRRTQDIGPIVCLSGAIRYELSVGRVRSVLPHINPITWLFNVVDAIYNLHFFPRRCHVGI
ncbi:MAG: hypothetical protein OXC80_00255 [Gammaproteobacteria bacterium]|nr:hypothetical protein [Gammaproteobacteria bacterium]